MAFQDFTISFTTSPIVEFNESSVGSIGPASTIFADIAAFNKIGPASTLSQLQLQEFFLRSDIIHYSDIAEFKANEIVLVNNLILRGTGFAKSWGMETVKLNIIDTQVGKILNIDESKSVIINNEANSSITFPLPENVPLGVAYTFVRTSSSGSITVNTEDTSHTILDASGVVASGISLDSIGSKLSVMSIGSGLWGTLNSQNTTTI